MKILSAGALLLASTSAAHAVGLDRSGRDITAIFEDGNYVELSYGAVRPEVGGTDDFVAPVPGLPAGAPAATYGDVGDDFNQIGAALTYQLDDRLTVALIYDQPFGVDIVYPTDTPYSLLGGTEARLNSNALTAMARYKFDDNWSVHGGFVVERLDAFIRLGGLAYGGLNGYNVTLGESTGSGFVVGSAYERPDIALRIALTYQSSIEHKFDSVEILPGIGQVSAPGAVTTVETPESWNLDFQTGVAENTLVFGHIRYADWERTIVSPAFFASQTGGGSLTSIDSDYDMSIGVARRFSDAFAASVTIGYEPSRGGVESPLSPTDGKTSLGVGGEYTIGDVVLAGGVRYTWVGDVDTGPSQTDVADFGDNTALSAGLRVGYRF